MSLDKVIWSEGLFLRPQHFQQMERYVEGYIHAGLNSLHGYAWGFHSLELDQEALAMGSVALRTASGLFPDGTPFQCGIPGQVQPAALRIKAGARAERILLTIPRRVHGATEVQFAQQEGSSLRYGVFDAAVPDACGLSPEECIVQLGRLQPRLVAESELFDDSLALPVARVMERRGDQSLVLDPDFIAPVLQIQTQPRVWAMVAELHTLLLARSQVLALRLGQGGRGVGDVADFMMLETINRSLGESWAHQQRAHLHPQELYQSWMRLSCSLATFTQDSRQPALWPNYEHGDLGRSLLPLFLDLKQSLSLVLEQHAVAIPLLDKGQGVRLAHIADRDLLKSAGFVLAVNADMPSQTLRQHFVAQSKIGPVDRIRDLVHLQLPGISIQPLAVAPRQIPYHAGSSYFEIEKGGELWRQLETNGALALHLAGDFPGLNLEFWAIRH